MKKLIIFVLIIFTISGCSSLQIANEDFFSMDTIMNIKVWAKTQNEAKNILSNAQQQINSLNNLLSRQVFTSEISKLNNANGEPTSIEENTYKALKLAYELAQFTNGAFDPTTAVLSDLWGIGSENPKIPTQSEIDQALKKTGYQNIIFLENNQIQLLNGVQIDLGGIGKGYATDYVLNNLNTPVLANLGGNIGIIGENPNSKDGFWNIGLANPDNNNSYIASVKIKNTSIVTSGDYERYFEKNGIRYHHIFDTKTGYPVQNELRAVTVIDKVSSRADALTTALFVMGLENGINFCKKNDITALFITNNKKIYTTKKVDISLNEGSNYEIKSV